jgi:teichuronic acid biosynthesis glycosyltransferase TuaC
MIQWAARRADASIGICAAFPNVLRGWNIEPARLEHRACAPACLSQWRGPGALPPAAAAPGTRRELGLDGSPVLLSIGHLIERKGHHLLIDALSAPVAHYPQARLVIAGAGEE